MKPARTPGYGKGLTDVSRKRLFEIIEKYDGDDFWSKLYDFAMIAIIIASLIPLAFKEESYGFYLLDRICVVIFIIDYILRWITADYKFEKHNVWSFVRYPVSLMALIDLISILPSLSFINNGFKVLRVLRMIRALRVFRVFKALRYSRTFEILGDVLRSSKRSLIAVGVLAGGYILVSALIMFTVEPDPFDNFFEAVYWATISLTTVGYGDIYPVTTPGRIITMMSSLFGVAVVALPAGIITAGYMNEINKGRTADGEVVGENGPDITETGEEEQIPQEKET